MNLPADVAVEHSIRASIYNDAYDSIRGSTDGVIRNELYNYTRPNITNGAHDAIHIATRDIVSTEGLRYG